MALADLARLAGAAEQLGPALAARLNLAGFDRAYVQSYAQQLPGLPAQLLTRGMAWLAPLDPRPAALALRLLVLGQALPAADLQRLLGDTLAADLAGAGLLLEAASGWSFPLRLELVNHLLIFSDPADDDPATVMAVGGSTKLLAGACYPQADIGRALDLGCGGGTLALLLAGACQAVVAIDINPRALQLARFNAALNGVHNVDWRLGHLYEPVAQERFDLVVAQPPFLPQPADAPRVLYLHGGARGDELALALLAQTPQHLQPGGVAVVLSDFPVLPQPLLQRLDAAVPAGGLLLLGTGQAVAAATQATLYGCTAATAPERQATALFQQLQALGIAEIEQAVVVLHAGPARSAVTVPEAQWAGLHRSQIDALLG